MTTIKYNKVADLCNVAQYGQTFAALVRVIEENIDTSRLTANQLAKIVEMLFEQKEYGRAEAIAEFCEA